MDDDDDDGGGGGAGAVECVYQARPLLLTVSPQESGGLRGRRFCGHLLQVSTLLSAPWHPLVSHPQRELPPTW